MKKVPKSDEPTELAQYRAAHPADSWKKFKKNEERRRAVQHALRRDQGGLCAYCEIDLRPASNEVEVDDFRVEHFHPKSDSNEQHNWHLDWQNLLACCHGGSNRNVVESDKRFTAPELSCDALKKGVNLDGQILNPLMLPAYPALFRCERPSGALRVNETACTQVGVSKELVESTIDQLGLNTTRLRLLRMDKLNKLNDQLHEWLVNGRPFQDAVRILAQIHLSKNSEGNWSAFFTSVRSFLSPDSEGFLHEIDFNG